MGFKQFIDEQREVNEIKLAKKIKSSGYKKGDKVVFNKPDNRQPKVVGYTNFTGTVVKDAGSGQEVHIKSADFTKAYGDDIAIVPADKIKTKVTEEVNESVSLDESDYQQVRDTVEKEVRRMRKALMEDAQMLGRIAEAMKDNGYDNREVKKIKDAEKHMDAARKTLTSV